jgi:hypothetical protein
LIKVLVTIASDAIPLEAFHPDGDLAIEELGFDLGRRRGVYADWLGRWVGGVARRGEYSKLDWHGG